MIPEVASLLTLFVVLAYVYRADFGRYSIGTVGVFERVKRSAVTGGDMDSVEMTCAECEQDLVTAERRQYWREIVICGAVVYKRDTGESFYCEDHVSFESRNDLGDATHYYAERLPMGLLKGVGKMLTLTPDIDAEDSEFSSTTNYATVGSVFSLLPLVIIVLAAIPMVKIVELYGRPVTE